MSRAYRIRVKISETLTREIAVEDGVCTDIELLDILPSEQMAGLLAEELKKDGYRLDDDGKSRKEEDGVAIEVDTVGGKVSATVQDTGTVEQVVVGRVERDTAAARERLRKDRAAGMDKQVGKEEQALQREVTKKLEGKLRDLQKELDGAVTRTTGGALKIRAAQLGEVQEIHEDKETGSLTIRVKV